MLFVLPYMLFYAISVGANNVRPLLLRDVFMKIFTKITSPQNPVVKQAAKLNSDAGERRAAGLFVLEGMRLCRDASDSGTEIEYFLFTGEAYEKYRDAADKLIALSGGSFEITEDVSRRISDTKNPQGFFCVCKTLDKTAQSPKIELFKAGKSYIALEGVGDPSNLGAAIRTAEALGFDGAVLCGCCDVYNPKAQRAAMGSLLRLPVFQTDDLPGLVRGAAAKGLLTLAAVVDAGATPVTKLPSNGGVMLIIGSEGSGLSKETIDAADMRVTIPMRGRAESLNAAAAAAILMWEIQRRDARGQRADM